jgi:uncharacterized protein
MLIEFYVENFLSFKDGATFSMLSTTKSLKDLQDPIFEAGKYSLLKSAGIWGQNAGGKSNFLKALSSMKMLVGGGLNPDEFENYFKTNRFRLNSDCDDLPTTFEVKFIIKNFEWKGETKDTLFRYGFQASSSGFYSEWLFGRFTAQESKLFIRDENGIHIGDKFHEGQQVQRALGEISDKALFLPLIHKIKGNNSAISLVIIDWFAEMVDVSSWLDQGLANMAELLLKRGAWDDYILKAFNYADICVSKIFIKELNTENAPTIDYGNQRDYNGLQTGNNNIMKFRVHTTHRKYNGEHKEIGDVAFSMDKEESSGSKQFFHLLGHIYLALEHGSIVLFDELSAKLHPHLCEVIISMFHSPKTNPKNAQLIFTTHNSLLLDRKIMRRDQIWFVDKNKYGESSLYSLMDYKKVRSDASYAKDYLIGKYGAVPFIGNFENLVAGEV